MEILAEDQWSEVKLQLPTQLITIPNFSALYNGCFYALNYEKESLYYFEMKSLLASCIESSGSLLTITWKQLDISKLQFSSLACFSNRLVATSSIDSAIFVHSPTHHNQPWIHFEDVEENVRLTGAVLPTGDIVAVRNCEIFKASLRGKQR